MRFLDLFRPIQKGNSGLTEEAIYKSIQAGGEFIPIWGGNQNHNLIERRVSVNAKTKKNKPVTVFEGEGIIISLDGSAGSMTYKQNQEFALNHHAGFFKIKKPKIILPEFFALFYQKQFQESSVSEGSKTLTLEHIYEMDFDIPSFDEQVRIMKAIGPVINIKNNAQLLLQRINKIQELILAEKHVHFQVKNYPVNKLLNCLSGNSNLTEKTIYQKIPLSGKRYIVLSSSTMDYTKLGVIPKCEIGTKQIKVFENLEGILIVRNGKAGTSFYLEKGRYTINDHAYILSLQSVPYDISLKWLMYQLKSTFLEYSSSSDNGTWNMTGFFSNTFVDIPAPEEQQKVLGCYEQLETFENKINSILKRISTLFRKQISPDCSLNT